MSENPHPFASIFKIGLTIRRFNRAPEKAMGLSIVQWYVLRCLLDRPIISAQGLAQAVGVHISTLTPSLKRLEKKDYIFTAKDPRDSRKKVISLTRTGKRALDQAELKIKPLFSKSNRLQSIQADLQRCLSGYAFGL